MQHCNSTNLGFSGPSFTWSNSRSSNHLILECLDHAFCNPEWNLLFPNALVTNCPKILSNHSPIVVSFFKSNNFFLERPFRFETYWLSHPNFQNIIEEVWKHSPSLDQAIDNFLAKVSRWNKNVFRNVFKRKLRILARLKGVQIALEKNSFKSLCRLDKSVQEEYL